MSEKVDDEYIDKVYDVFADEYINVEDKDPIAPPERYIEITEELLIRNSARWFINALGAMAKEVEVENG